MLGATVRLLLMIVGSFAVMVCNERAAYAQNYPWCAEGSYKGGATNCGFVTLQQCMDTVRGGAEFCEPNSMYQPPPGPHELVRHPRRRPH
jgi:hypothetical protein